MEGQTALQERIRMRAYSLWEQAGRPDGTALAHWLEAEREAEATALPANPASTPKRSRSAAGTAPVADSPRPRTRRVKAKADA